MNYEQSPAASVERVLGAAPELVFDEWLDPRALADWMCPRPARPIAIEIDPRINGRFRFDIEEHGTSFSVTGRYLALDRPHLLRFTWSCSDWEQPDHESVVTVTLTRLGSDRTMMTIRHSQLPDDQITPHEHGWARVADQLAGALMSRA